MLRAFMPRRARFVLLAALAVSASCRRSQNTTATAPVPIDRSPAQSESSTESSLPGDSRSTPSNSGGDDERRARARDILTTTIYFQFDRDELDLPAREALDAKVEILRADPAYQLRIEGHADERGSDEYNVALAMRRATAVHRYLAARGIPPTHLEVASFGEERPACVGATESCWQKNRRAEFGVSP